MARLHGAFRPVGGRKDVRWWKSCRFLARGGSPPRERKLPWLGRGARSAESAHLRCRTVLGIKHPAVGEPAAPDMQDAPQGSFPVERGYAPGGTLPGSTGSGRPAWIISPPRPFPIMHPTPSTIRRGRATAPGSPSSTIARSNGLGHARRALRYAGGSARGPIYTTPWGTALGQRDRIGQRKHVASVAWSRFNLFHGHRHRQTDPGFSDVAGEIHRHDGLPLTHDEAKAECIGVRRSLRGEGRHGRPRYITPVGDLESCIRQHGVGCPACHQVAVGDIFGPGCGKSGGSAPTVATGL